MRFKRILAAVIGITMVCVSFPLKNYSDNSYFTGLLSHAVTLKEPATATASTLSRSDLITSASLTKKLSVSSVKTENPFNKQDDKEVIYDGSCWVQPKEWNVPIINPRNYEGGIMLFFDKIGLEPGYANGKTQRIYFSLTGATEPVSLIKFHVFYDTRLTVKEDSNGEVITAGKALKGFTTGSSMMEDGQLVFYAYSNDNTLLSKGSIFTIDFIVPENAEQGDVYPIGLSYVDDGIVSDIFINSEQDEAGRLQMTYVFTKGIYNGYIKIMGDKKKTAPVYDLGDVNNDGYINAVDASYVLSYYAMISANKNGSFDDSQQIAADVNNDGWINAVDASCILSYYAYISTTKEETMSLAEFIKK